MSVLAAACDPSTGNDTGQKEQPQTESQPVIDFSAPPPNAPPPPAACGDMNGGGDQHVDFNKLVETKTAEKPEAMMRQLALLEQRYDLAARPSDVTMTRGKPLQVGARTRLPDGQTFESLA